MSFPSAVPAPPAFVRRLLPLLAVGALLGPLLVATAAPAKAGPVVVRLAGADRYTTAVAVSQSSHPSGAPVAILTTGASFPDALAGGPAASVLGGPVLLVQRDRVPTVALDELRRLHPQRVLILGGAAAVSGAVTAQLAGEAFSVERVAGSDRYETAALISQRTFSPGADDVYVATGEN